jgi:hypothetical protein
MKRQKSCGPRLGKLVHQLPGVVTFAYDLRFRRMIARWKGIVEEIHFGGSIMPSTIIENLDLKKPSFRPSKWPRKLKPAKNSKLPKLPESCFEPVGKGGWPPISTWIITPWNPQDGKSPLAIMSLEEAMGMDNPSNSTLPTQPSLDPQVYSSMQPSMNVGSSLGLDIDDFNFFLSYNKGYLRDKCT